MLIYFGKYKFLTFKIKKSFIDGVYCIKRDFFEDKRGKFARLFCQNELGSFLKERKIVQINYSKSSVRGTLRGLHYQCNNHKEMKIIQCLRGSVFDVVVDIRKNSPTFMKWDFLELSDKNDLMFVIPEGCAHGFQTLEDNTELLYFHTEYYKPEEEKGIKFDDPLVAIDWPLEPICISSKDSKIPFLDTNFYGI